MIHFLDHILKMKSCLRAYSRHRASRRPVWPTSVKFRRAPPWAYLFLQCTILIKCSRVKFLVTALTTRYAVASEMTISLSCCCQMVVLVPLSLLIKRDGHPDEFHALKCPARKPLVNIVRPILNRMLSPQSADHAEPVLVKLDVRKASRHVDWTSQAREFAVSFFFIWAARQ